MPLKRAWTSLGCKKRLSGDLPAFSPLLKNEELQMGSLQMELVSVKLVKH